MVSAPLPLRLNTIFPKKFVAERIRSGAEATLINQQPIFLKKLVAERIRNGEGAEAT